MGVPKFYRWLSERYPTLSEVISDSQIPEFDNLYLDMNGIIHNCSHPNDDDVTFRITEEQIFLDIFDYIEKLFLIVRPQKVFYLAVDGVAPRAKMNQQRARRFMSARTAQEQLEKAMKKGEEIPDEKRFDSNCITPGTPFMVRLHSELSQWIAKKINGDAKWQGIRVILSGHNVPGEGEHKIMDFIRTERINEAYDANTRHCMYGLDADLIMLGICSHEPHFSLLREEVKFGRQPRPTKKKPGQKAPPAVKKPTAPSQTTFHLLHLSLLREYLAWEFYSVKDQLSFAYDMERIIDDWVLMGFLVGNDFIPHLPHVHIHDDGLPFLFDAYKKVLPTLDGYINESGYLNLKRFEIFLKAVAENDRDHFLKMIEDESYLKGKRQQVVQPGAMETLLEEQAAAADEELVAFQDSDMSDATTDDEDVEESGETSSGDAAFISSDEEELDPTQKSTTDDDLGIASAADALANLDAEDPVEEEFVREMAMAALSHMDDKEFESNLEACWSRTIGNGFKRHKKNYYKEKLKFGNISKDQLKSQSEGYVRAIQWILHYYYHGCVSWNWYFEHHYAPYISDVADFSGMEMGFELSEPFHPFEQLLAVLPAASADCLPPALRELMISTESAIADFYPTDFKTDLNGKQNDWEAVVLIPFIAEKRLLEAIQSKEPLLSTEEKNRNKHGHHCLFTTQIDEQTRSPKANLALLDMNLFRIPKEKVVWGLLSNAKLDVYFPGFPTMKHLPHTGKLKSVGVSVFNQPSRRPSMVLTIGHREDQAADMPTLATDLIGKEVCVEWPVLKMGIVDHVTSLTHRYQGLDSSLSVEELDADEQAAVQKRLQALKDRQITRFAIDCGNPKAIAYVKRFLGITYETKDNMLIPRKQYGSAEDAIAVPVNLVVTNITVEQGRRLAEIPIEKAYPFHSRVFVMSPSVQAFGYACLVDSIENVGKENCRIRVMCAVIPHPDLSKIKSNMAGNSLPWFDTHQTSKRTERLNMKVIGRITGTIFLIDGDRPKGEETGGYRINIGLNLKLSKRNLETPDYTRRVNEMWLYSSLAVNLINDYQKRFPELFSVLQDSASYNDVYYSHEIWENEKVREKRLPELQEYLSGLPTASIEKQDGGAQVVDSLLLSKVENQVKAPRGHVQMFKGSVRPDILFKPDLYDGKIRPDPDADFQLLDRVVSIVSGSLSFGHLGTIIGIFGDQIEVLFDKEFKGGIKKLDMASVVRLSITSVINITYGKERKGKPKKVPAEQRRQPPPARNEPQQRLAAGRNSNNNTATYSQKVQYRGEAREKPNRRNRGNVETGEQQQATSSKVPVKARADETKASSSKAPETKNKAAEQPKMILLKREKTEEEENEKRKVQDQLSSLLGLKKAGGAATAAPQPKEPQQQPVQPIIQLLKRGDLAAVKEAENQQPTVEKILSKIVVGPAEASPSSSTSAAVGGGGHSGSAKKSHPKDRVFVNKTIPHPPLQQTQVTQQKEMAPMIMMISPLVVQQQPQLSPLGLQQISPWEQQQQRQSAPPQAAPPLIPTSNVDPLKVTDLRPSTISTFKRGGGYSGPRGGGRKITNPRLVPATLPDQQSSDKLRNVPKQPAGGGSTTTTTAGGSKRQRKCRLAATFSTD